MKMVDEKMKKINLENYIYYRDLNKSISQQFLIEI